MHKKDIHHSFSCGPYATHAIHFMKWHYCGLHVETHQWLLILNLFNPSHIFILKSLTFTMPSSLTSHHIISQQAHNIHILLNVHTKWPSRVTLHNIQNANTIDIQIMRATGTPMTWCWHQTATTIAIQNMCNKNTYDMMLAFPLMLLFILRNDELLLTQTQITINRLHICPSWKNHIVNVLILIFQLESMHALMEKAWKLNLLIVVLFWKS